MFRLCSSSKALIFGWKKGQGWGRRSMVRERITLEYWGCKAWVELCEVMSPGERWRDFWDFLDFLNPLESFEDWLYLLKRVFKFSENNFLISFFSSFCFFSS